jgi:hypothetical protein
MTGLIISAVVPGLDDPEPSETKLGRQFGSSIDWDHVQETAATPSVAVAAPLDRQRLTDAAERARVPQWQTGVFRVPYGMREDQLATLCREMAGKWFAEMNRRGFDLCSSSRLVINFGPNPSRDLQSGLIVPGHRDMLLRAQFVERQPEPVRLELPGYLFEPWSPRQGRHSGDEGDLE